MIQLELITSRGMSLSEEVYEVIIDTADGQIGVLEGHASLIGLTIEGVIAVRRDAKDTDEMLEYFAVSKNAVIEVGGSKVRVLADDAERSDDINEQESKKAYDLASKMVADAKDKQSLDQAMASLDRSAVRLKVADLKRRQRR